MDARGQEVIKKAAGENQEGISSNIQAKWELQKVAERTVLMCDPEDPEQPPFVDSYRIAEIEKKLRYDKELQLNEEDFDFLIPAKPEATVRHRLAGYYAEMRLRSRELEIAVQKMLDDRIEHLTVTETREKEWSRLPHHTQKQDQLAIKNE